MTLLVGLVEFCMAMSSIPPLNVSDRPATTPRRWFRLIALGSLGLYALLCVTVWAEESWRPHWDSATYLLTAKSLAAGEGYTYQGKPFFLRPPGFSFLLSLFVEEGEYDMKVVVRAVMATVAAAVVAIYFAVRTVYGPWTALAVALLTGVSPLFVRNFNWVLSDFPFAALFFSAVACLHISARRSRGWWSLSVAGAVLLAGALYMRTTGILLLPGMLLLGLTRDRGWGRWRALLPVVLVSIAIAPWLHHSARSAESAESPSEQLFVYDYKTGMFHVDPGDPTSPYLDLEGWLERLAKFGPRGASELARCILPVAHPVATWGVLLVVFLGLFLSARRQPSLLEWFALTYGLLLVTYFDYSQRLVMLLTPFAYLYLLVAAGAVGRLLAKRLSRPLLERATVGTAVVLLLALNAWQIPAMLDARPARGAAGPGRQKLENLVEWVRTSTPEDAVILCDAAPIFAFLTGRPTATYRYYRGPGLIDRVNASFVVFDALVPPEFIPEAMARADGFWKLEKGGNGRVGALRVRPR